MLKTYLVLENTDNTLVNFAKMENNSKELTVLLEYLKWADNQILSLIQESVNPSIEELAGENGLIFKKVLHLAEEYTAWLMDIQDLSWKSEIERINKLDFVQLIEVINTRHVDWSAYLKNPKLNFIIDEGNFKVPISLQEVIFNLVNHASYHRGQIVSALREIQIDVPITDFYWFKISKLSKA